MGIIFKTNEKLKIETRQFLQFLREHSKIFQCFCPLASD